MRLIATALLCAGVLLTAAGCASDTQQNPVISAVKPSPTTRPTATGDVKAPPVRRVAASGTAGEPTDPVVVASIRKALCLSENGGLDDTAHKRLGIYLKSIGQPPSERFLHREMILLNRLVKKNQTASCSLFG